MLLIKGKEWFKPKVQYTNKNIKMLKQLQQI